MIIINLYPVDKDLIYCGASVSNCLHLNDIGSLAQIGMGYTYLMIVDNLSIPLLIIYLVIIEIYNGMVIGIGAFNIRTPLQPDTHGCRTGGSRDVIQSQRITL